MIRQGVQPDLALRLSNTVASRQQYRNRSGLSNGAPLACPLWRWMVIPFLSQEHT